MASILGIKINRFALSVATLAACIAVIVVGVSGLRGAQAGPATPAQVDPLPVATALVRIEDGAEIETRFPALIAARRESALGFESGGRIAEVGYDVGDSVEAGAALARLDTRTLDAQLLAARAQISAAEARAALAQVTLARQRQLVAQGHVSPQRLDEAGADADAARAQAQAARADAEALQVRIDLSQIEAPFAGVVTRRFADEGAIAAPGAPVLHLVEDAALELRAGLPQADAMALAPGEAYRAELNGREIEVRFRASTGVIDSRRRSVTVIFDAAPETGARSGEVARLILPTRLNDRGFWAPLTALSEGRRGLWSIYVLTPDGAEFVLEPRPVEIVHTEGERVYVTGAVRDGEAFLASGVHRVAPGQRVRPAGGA